MVRSVLLAAALAAGIASADPPATAPATRSAWATTRPTTLKLVVDADNVNAAGQQLTRQLGTRVQVYNVTGGVHYAGEEKPYAAAVADFLQAAALTPTDNGMGLSLTGGKPLRVLPLGDTGVLVVSRLTANASRALFVPNQSTSYSYSLQGAVILDPALEVVGLSQYATIETIDATPPTVQRESGPGFDPFAVSRALGDSSQAMRLNVSFNANAPVTKVHKIAGRLKGWRVAEQASVDVSFDQIAEGQPVEGRGVTATVTVDGRGGRQGMLNVVLNGPALDLYKNGNWQQGLARLVTAYDIDGGVLPTQVFGNGRTSGGSVQLTLRGDQRGGPAMRGAEFFDQLTTLKVRVPTKLKAVELPFEITDIDLTATP